MVLSGEASTVIQLFEAALLAGGFGAVDRRVLGSTIGFCKVHMVERASFRFVTNHNNEVPALLLLGLRRKIASAILFSIKERNSRINLLKVRIILSWVSEDPPLDCPPQQCNFIVDF